MSIKKQIPNLITLLNLLSGIIATMFAVIGELQLAALFVVFGIIFDFFDGFTARLLKVQGELGKQLDSLADVITSGLVPGIVMFQLLRHSLGDWSYQVWFTSFHDLKLLPFFGLLITLASAYRLANFNIDERQTSSFIGLPTPANTLLIISLPLIIDYSNNEFFISLLDNKYILIAITLLGSYLLNAEIPLFSLKFKTYKFKENRIKYIFLISTILLITTLKFVAIPLVIFLYVAMSMLENLLKKLTI